MMNFKSISLLVVTSALTISIANAQNTLTTLTSGDGNISKNLRGQKIADKINSGDLGKLLGLNVDNHFEQTKSTTDALGILHTNFQQFYKNIKVEGALVMIHSKDGLIQSINGKYVNTKNIPSTPTIDEMRATSIAQDALKIVGVTRNYAPELVIYKGEQNPELVFAVRVDGRVATHQLLMKKVFINAQTGTIVDIEDLMTDADVPASGISFLSGDTLHFTANFNGVDKYILKDSTRNIQTFDGTNSEPNFGSANLFPTAKNYTNNSSTWGKKPAISRTRMYVTTSNILSGLTSTIRPFGMIVAPDTISQHSSWPTVFSTSALPLNANGFYHFIEPGINYVGVFGKMNTNTGNVTDTIVFPIDSTNTGSYGWADTLGNSGIYTVLSIANPAVDAHWGMTKTHDYYVSKFNRNSYDGNGSIVKNYVNGMYGIGGTQSNASAMQSPYNVMVFGMGDGSQTKPFVTLDVSGHEFTHLVTSKNGNGGLRYRAESGALNESFSDMFGVSIDFYTNPTTANWDIGDGVFFSTYILRSMSNPKLLGDPDTYKGENWVNTSNTSSSNDNGGVHTNSSVANKWYYLICTGGTGTNDNGYNYNVTSIGITKGEQIAYRTLTQYLTQDATFEDAFSGSLQAVLDLYGNDTLSAEYTTVKEAWYAVGLGEGLTPNSIKHTALTNENVQVYPNPATGNSFEISSSLDKSFTAIVYNALGQQIQQININKGQNKVRTNHWAKGVYTISFQIDGKPYANRVSVY